MEKINWRGDFSEYQKIVALPEIFRKLNLIKEVVSKWDSNSVIDLFADFRIDEKGLPSGMLIKINNCFAPGLVSDFGCGYGLIAIKDGKQSILKNIQNWELLIQIFQEERCAFQNQNLREIFYSMSTPFKDDYFYEVIADKNLKNSDFGSLYNHFFEIRSFDKPIVISNQKMELSPETDLIAVIHSGSIMLENYFWEKLFINFSLESLEKYPNYNSEESVTQGLVMLPYNSDGACKYIHFFNQFNKYSILSREYAMVILENALKKFTDSDRLKCFMLSNLSHVNANNKELFRGVQKITDRSPVLIGGNRYSPSALISASNIYLPHGSFSFKATQKQYETEIEKIMESGKNTVGNNLPEPNVRKKNIINDLNKLNVSLESTKGKKNKMLGYLYPVLNVHQ
jgi:hypothetical protein